MAKGIDVGVEDPRQPSGIMLIRQTWSQRPRLPRLGRTSFNGAQCWVGRGLGRGFTATAALAYLCDHNAVSCYSPCMLTRRHPPHTSLPFPCMECNEIRDLLWLMEQRIARQATAALERVSSVPATCSLIVAQHLWVLHQLAFDEQSRLVGPLLQLATSPHSSWW